MARERCAVLGDICLQWWPRLSYFSSTRSKLLFGFLLFQQQQEVRDLSLPSVLWGDCKLGRNWRGASVKAIKAGEQKHKHASPSQLLKSWFVI